MFKNKKDMLGTLNYQYHSLLCPWSRIIDVHFCEHQGKNNCGDLLVTVESCNAQTVKVSITTIEKVNRMHISFETAVKSVLIIEGSEAFLDEVIAQERLRDLGRFRKFS